MTELSFLVSLLLEHKLSPTTKKAVAERIKEVESRQAPAAPQIQAQVQRPPKTLQSASTQRILDEMASNGETLPVAPVVTEAPPAAVTPATIAALNHRAQTIALAASKSGPPADPLTGRPRKF